MAHLKVIKKDATLRLHCSGRWDALRLASAIEIMQAEVLPMRNTVITFDLDEITHFDTAAALLLHRDIRILEANDNDVILKTEDQAVRRMFEMVGRHAHPESTFVTKMPGMLESVGAATVEFIGDTKGLLAFVGETFWTFIRLFSFPRTFRWREMLFQMNESGIKALWIIALTIFLVGVVVAYQSAVQLKTYGANIFIVDMLGISILRELAPMLTAIVVAGRSGSAFAAQIGVMKMTEEIDAMRTMGFDPFAFLVLPRILALIVMMPILIFFADVAGVVGGMVVANIELDITMTLFLERFREAVDIKHFWVGMIKGPFFAAFIAFIGIYRGMLVKNNTESIGFNTTKSVVEAIFAVIILDALFSIIFTNLGF